MDNTYTQEEFKEDTKLINFTIYKYFYKFLDLKDDMLSEGYIAVLRAKEEYKKDGGSTLSTLKILFVKRRLISFLNKHFKTLRKQNELNTSRLSLNMQIAEDATLEDVLEDTTLSFDKVIEYEIHKEYLKFLVKTTYLNMQAKSYTKRGGKLKGQLFFQIVEEYYKQAFEDKQPSMAEIGRKLGVSKQIVSLSVIKFQEALKKTALKYEND